MNIRSRVLDEFSSEDVKGKWRQGNMLFCQYTPECDIAFCRGTPMDVEKYIMRKGPRIDDTPDKDDMYEENDTPDKDDIKEKVYLKNFFAPGGLFEGKVHLLIGKVGSGKTSFVNYLCEKMIYDELSCPMAIGIDCLGLPRSESAAKAELEDRFKEYFELYLIDGPRQIFSDKVALYKEMLRQSGKRNPTDDDAISKSEHHLDTSSLLHFLLSLDSIHDLLIVLDNIDENHHDAVLAGKTFAINICNYIWRYISFYKRRGIQKRACVLIPVREYTADYFMTHRPPKTVLDPLPIREYFVNRLYLMKACIEEKVEEIEILPPPTKYWRHSKFYMGSRPTYIISKERAIEFISRLTEKIHGEGQELVGLIENLAAGNLRMAAECLYYLFHSCKLPIIKLFEKLFSESVDKRNEDVDEYIYYSQGVELLMAIHYPFYDVDDSPIINVFNAGYSNATNAFHNSLAIPRLLLYLNNIGGEKKIDLFKFFRKFAYPKSAVLLGLKKCMKKGLLDTASGIDIGHLSDNTSIRLSEAGKEYVRRIIFEPSYLQYACEDTPMPVEYQINISKKYEGNNAKENRMESVQKFISFIRQEENLEAEALARLEYNSDLFFEKTGFDFGGATCKLFDMFMLKTEPRLQGILKSNM